MDQLHLFQQSYKSKEKIGVEFSKWINAKVTTDPALKEGVQVYFKSWKPALTGPKSDVPVVTGRGTVSNSVRSKQNGHSVLPNIPAVTMPQLGSAVTEGKESIFRTALSETGAYKTWEQDYIDRNCHKIGMTIEEYFMWASNAPLYDEDWFDVIHNRHLDETRTWRKKQ